ncbi:hypothetical protein G9A89_017520 [Geosiphon pyriformis]|nr:hypothetical protein G9A89_017520 [Geosiphon pyriformis]
MTNLVWKIATCNVKGMMNLTKQENIIHWHLKSVNLVSIFTETKLKLNTGPWIKNKFERVQIFTSGSKKSFFGAGVAILMCCFLAQHVSRIEKVSSYAISVHLLFKKVIDYVFLSKTLFSAITGHKIGFVFEFFDTNHKIVGVLVRLKDLVDAWLTGGQFKELSSALLSTSLDSFMVTRNNGNLNGILELLVAKLIKCLGLGLMDEFDCLVKKSYRKSKFYEAELTKNKGSIIRSVLECLFHKVVLNHLVQVPSFVPDLWARQYVFLAYMKDDAFSSVINEIGLDKFSLVVGKLLDGKAAGLSDITNKLWKYCNNNMLLYNWNGILTNTRSIALLETMRKILFKILSDWISLICSMSDILHGNNFFILKNTSIQSSVFAVSLVVEDALEKG